MRVVAMPNIYLPDPKLNFRNIKDVKPAEVTGTNVPKPQKSVYVYSGGYGTYSNRSRKENLALLDETFRKFKENVREAQWKEVTIESLDGRNIKMYYSAANEELDRMLKGQLVDIQL